MSNNVDNNFKAAILDMDGVITQTAKLHAEAWKKMFDEFLKKRNGSDFEPLDIETDYKKHIDGIPRFDGVRRFLASRNIDIPEGTPKDDPEKESVFGLGMRKNEIFLEILKQEGVQVYNDTLEMIKKWKQNDIKLAVISSSKNCKHIMESAGISDMFDVRVDGETSEKESLKGKPEPDIFLKASDLLGVEVDQTIVIEDAIYGVQAGKSGKFAYVIGVSRNGDEKALKEAGADLVVKKLTDLEDKIKPEEQGNMPEDLPHAIKKIESVFEIIGSKKPVLFLDYDGTLTPIVSDPEKAILSDEIKKIITELSESITVGVISGRDRKDLKSKVAINTLIYAGSHGFDITGPNGLEMQYEPGQKTLPALDEVQENLNERLKDLEGVQIERKKYAIAVHYRNVDESKVPNVEKAVFEELEQQEKLKKGSGKKILELKPDLDWHKGRALNWLMEQLGLSANKYIPVFIGDDVTDEDALEIIKGEGIGIIVGTHSQKTAASFRLEDTDEVARFLEILKDRLKE